MRLGTNRSPLLVALAAIVFGFALGVAGALARGGGHAGFAHPSFGHQFSHFDRHHDFDHHHDHDHGHDQDHDHDHFVHHFDHHDFGHWQTSRDHARNGRPGEWHTSSGFGDRHHGHDFDGMWHR